MYVCFHRIEFFNMACSDALIKYNLMELNLPFLYFEILQV